MRAILYLIFYSESYIYKIKPYIFLRFTNTTLTLKLILFVGLIYHALVNLLNIHQNQLK